MARWFGLCGIVLGVWCSFGVQSEARGVLFLDVSREMSVGGVVPEFLSTPQSLVPGYHSVSAQKSSSPFRGQLGVSRRSLTLNSDLLTAGLIVLIPTVAIELTLFLGNLAAFSTKKRLLAWGIQGMGFSILGGAITLPWIIMGIDSGLTASFIALHVALLGISITNIVLGTNPGPVKQGVAFVPWGTSSGGGIACVGKF